MNYAAHKHSFSLEITKLNEYYAKTFQKLLCIKGR